MLCMATGLMAQDWEGETEENVAEEDMDVTFDTDLFLAQPNWYTLGEGIRFTSTDKDYSMHINGFIQPSYERVFGADTLGNSYDLVRYRMARARIRISGASARTKMSYRLSFDVGRESNVQTDEVEASNRILWDAFVTYRALPFTRVSIGQKAPRTNYREFFMVSNTTQFVDRSRITSLFSVFRDVGLFIDRRDKIYRDLYMKSYLEITTGEGQNGWTNYGGLKYGGRIDLFPLGLFQGGEFNGLDMVREWKPKLVVGGAYSYIDGVTSRNGNFRSFSDRFFYTDANGQTVLPGYEKYVADFLFKYRGMVLMGAYVRTSATVPQEITTPEETVRGRMNLGEIWNIQAGYLTRRDWSFDVRYQRINDLVKRNAEGDILPESETFLDAGIYNRPEYYTFSVAKYIQKYAVKVQSALTYNTVNTDTGGDLRIYSGANPSGGSDIDVAIPKEFTFQFTVSMGF